VKRKQVPRRVAPRDSLSSSDKLVNKIPSPPCMFVSVASKGLRVYVSDLESTLAGISISVDSKGVCGGVEGDSGSGESLR
jgi:hypothetical protein